MQSQVQMFNSIQQAPPQSSRDNPLLGSVSWRPPSSQEADTLCQAAHSAQELLRTVSGPKHQRLNSHTPTY